MFWNRSLVAGLVAMSLSTGAMAEPAAIAVEDAYARAASAMAMSGAAFMVLRNAGTEDDVLIAARTDAAKRVELHTHVEDANGVMRMTELEAGLPIPAGAERVLKRGGDHVMLMGLNGPLEQGGQISLTLVFEKAGEVTVVVPVDNARLPDGMSGG
ncbi:MAG: copper chaperone PCu(A)C [Rhodobacteraceae bacterium]|nr:copper chaperone PCu(A)C [Paracoccaceae bacterium]